MHILLLALIHRIEVYKLRTLSASAGKHSRSEVVTETQDKLCKQSKLVNPTVSRSASQKASSQQDQPNYRVRPEALA